MKKHTNLHFYITSDETSDNEPVMFFNIDFSEIKHFISQRNPIFLALFDRFQIIGPVG